MTAFVLVPGLAAVLAVAAVAASLFGVWRARALAEVTQERSEARFGELQSALSGLQKTIDRQAEQLAELQQQPAPAASGIPRAGLNLCKRSQALRMHRKGDPPERIASALDVPRQEVDLLLKVHRIVVGRI